MFKRYNLVLDPDDKEQGTKLAKEMGVSFSWLIRHLLRNWLKEQDKPKTIQESYDEVKKYLKELKQSNTKVL